MSENQNGNKQLMPIKDDLCLLQISNQFIELVKLEGFRLPVWDGCCVLDIDIVKLEHRVLV